ncbi:MAG: hypothetical protein AB1414_00130 [bacterium]
MSILKNQVGIIILICFVLLQYPINASARKAGGDTYAFLNLGPGARALGLGGAFVAIADDSSASYWNPAGLAMIKSREVILMSDFGGNNEIETKYSYMSSASPINLNKLLPLKFFKNSDGIGISLINFGVDDIPKTGIDAYNEIIKIGAFDDEERAFIFSYGNEIIEEFFLVGISFKYITHKFDGHSGKGFGIDLGALANVSSMFDRKYKTILGLRNVRIGGCIKNNFKKKWDSGPNDEGSISSELGLAFDLLKDRKWTCSLALKQGEERPLIASLGTEFQLIEDLLTIRGGINNWYLENRYKELDLKKLNYARKWSLGVGIRVGRGEIDYAISSGRFETKHQLSTTIKF